MPRGAVGEPGSPKRATNRVASPPPNTARNAVFFGLRAKRSRCVGRFRRMGYCLGFRGALGWPRTNSLHSSQRTEDRHYLGRWGTIFAFCGAGYLGRALMDVCTPVHGARSSESRDRTGEFEFRATRLDALPNAEACQRFDEEAARRPFAGGGSGGSLRGRPSFGFGGRPTNGCTRSEHVTRRARAMRPSLDTCKSTAPRSMSCQYL